MLKFESLNDKKFEQLNNRELQKIKGGKWKYYGLEVNCDTGQSVAIWEKNRSGRPNKYKRVND